MRNLTEKQRELKSSIVKSAIIWGSILGMIAGAVTFWLTGDMSPANRTQITGMVAGGVGFLLFLLISRSAAKSAKCEKCSAAYSISRTDRKETLLSSEDKSEHEKLENGGSKLTTWKEEKYEVLETFTCSRCGNVTTKISQLTRKKDEVVREKVARPDQGPADDAPAKAISSNSQKGAGLVSGVAGKVPSGKMMQADKVLSKSKSSKQK